MHLRMAALMMTLLLVLTGCGGNANESIEHKVRQNYAALAEFSGRALVTADYGDKVYQYEVEMFGDLDSGSLKVLSPESIAGTGFHWSDDAGSVSYDDVALETGRLSPDGLSPVDAMPLVLEALTTGRLLAFGEEMLEGEETFFLELANPTFQEGAGTVLVWLSPEDHGLRRCEITWDGTTVITCSFTQFTFTTDEYELEG